MNATDTAAPAATDPTTTTEHAAGNLDPLGIDGTTCSCMPPGTVLAPLELELEVVVTAFGLTTGTLVGTTFQAGRIVAGPLPEDGQPSRPVVVEGPTIHEMYRGVADALELLVPDLRREADEQEAAAAEHDARCPGTEPGTEVPDDEPRPGSDDVDAEQAARAKHPTAVCCKERGQGDGGTLAVGALDLAGYPAAACG